VPKPGNSEYRLQTATAVLGGGQRCYELEASTLLHSSSVRGQHCISLLHMNKLSRMLIYSSCVQYQILMKKPVEKVGDCTRQCVHLSSSRRRFELSTPTTKGPQLSTSSARQVAPSGDLHVNCVVKCSEEWRGILHRTEVEPETARNRTYFEVTAVRLVLNYGPRTNLGPWAVIISYQCTGPLYKTEINDRRGSAALTTRHPSIRKSWH
jgi:hypothetical protein